MGSVVYDENLLQSFGTQVNRCPVLGLKDGHLDSALFDVTMIFIGHQADLFNKSVEEHVSGVEMFASLELLAQCNGCLHCRYGSLYPMPRSIRIELDANSSIKHLQSFICTVVVPRQERFARLTE